MAKYGEYSNDDSVLVLYENGIFREAIENVIPETIFMQKVDSLTGDRLLEFQTRTAHYRIQFKKDDSFCIFPNWMKGRIHKNDND